MRFYLLVILFNLISSSLASAQKRDFEGLLNKMLAPGPLMKGHEQLEHTDCLKCHEPGGGVPNSKCTDCHTEIGEQILKNTAFHGRMKKEPCIECHKDHQGRSYDSAKIDENKFDHSKTGFILDGAHAQAKCSDCHTGKRSSKVNRPGDTRYFGTSPSCISCHKSEDIHFFTDKKRNTECSECHTTKAWKPSQGFNHLRESGHALVGKHASISCQKCHVPNGPSSAKYDWPQLKTAKCLSCHEDHHKNNLSPKFRGGNCESCHSQETWNIALFDHSVTGFKLRGQHAKIQCKDCHKQAPALARQDQKFYNWTGLSSSCSSCHEDYHGFKARQSRKIGNLGECQTCHMEESWKTQLSFKHNTQTIFPLIGKHKKNACFDCHIPEGRRERGVKAKPAPQNIGRHYQFPELAKKDCQTCHTSPHSRSFHKKFEGVQCSSCHSPEGWNVMISGKGGLLGGDRSFHDKTRFPLTGKHKQATCKSCHVVNGKEVYRFANAKLGFCVDCHKGPHRRQFSPKFQANRSSCAECHTTNSFDQLLQFDHSKTDFPLTGSHKTIANKCEECHKPTRMMLPVDPPRPANRYLFPGKKKGFCENCHTNVHKEQFTPKTQQRACSDCHTTVKFEKRKPFNHDTTRFKLTGKHEKIGSQCSECHKPTKNLLPTKPPKAASQFMFNGASKGFCTECHENQHKDMFKPKFSKKPCYSCHITESFERLKPFNHNQTDFSLKGKHKKVECSECHTPTKKRFKTRPFKRKGLYQFPQLEKQNCQTCHEDPHNGSRGPTCTKCHTESGWEYADQFHREFTLKGVHFQLTCEQCHTSDKRLKGASDDCTSCHQHEDPHQGMLGNNCADCHRQSFWESVSFNHNTTRFPLVGAHRLTDCRSCHNQGVYQGLPTDCIGCHQQDALSVTQPNHDSLRFRPCEQCHNQFFFEATR